MKNLSKVLAVVLALVMALSMVSFAAYTDVADDANYAEAVSVLSSLEMLKGYEDGTFKPEGEITRAEFAMVICRLIGSGAAAETTGATSFTDVAADHWASGAIALAAQNGIVNGKGDGIFDPEAPVKYEEAIKMVVAALGYSAVAETYGAYPTGYQIVAAQTGVLDGITDGKAGLPASRGVVAQLAYNALEVPMMTQTGFGTNVAYNYDNTLLLNRLNVVKVEATIAGTAKSNGSLKADEVALTIHRQFAAEKENSEAGWYAVGTAGIKPVINTAAWVTASKVKADAEVIAKAEALMDYKVDAYVINPTDTRKAELVAIEMKDAGYSEIAFASEDIDMNETALGSGELAIYTDETKDESEIYDIAIERVYLNGRVNAGLLGSIATFLADTAECDIRLFDNDGDDVYEIAYVTAYVDYVVDSVNARNYRVIGATAPTNPVLGTWPQRLILDEENEDYTFEIIKDGEVVDFTAIAENDVLSVAGGYTTNDLTYGTVIINTQSVAGTVNGLDDVNNIILIDGVEYPYNTVIEAMAEGMAPTLTLGDEAEFYINARGIICGLDATSKVGKVKYGFVTVAMNSTGLTANTVDLRMMDTEGTWNTYALADTYTLNGTSYTDNAAAFIAAKAGTDSSSRYVYNQVVGYELDETGAIDAIYTTHTANAFEIAAAPGSPAAYNASTEMYNGKVLTDATVIFTVPTTPSSSAAVAEKDVAIATKDVLVDRATYTMAAYNVTDEGEAPVLFGAGITGRIDWASTFMVITGKTTRTNAEGTVGVQFTGLVNGEEVTLFAATELGKAATVLGTTVSAGVIGEGSSLGNAGALAKGDVIIYSVNGAGEAAKIVRIQDAATIDGHIDAANTLVDHDGDGATATPTPEIIVPTFNTGAVVVGTVDVAGTTYTYYLGYVSEIKSARLTIQEDMTTSPAATQTLTLKADSIVTEIDTNHATGVKVLAGDMGSFLADGGIATGTPDFDGDIALIKAVNDVVVVEAVVYKNK